MKKRGNLYLLSRFCPDFDNLQKKNRRNLLCYSGLGGMWGSNPRHSEPQSDALPTELRPPCCSFSKAVFNRFFLGTSAFD